MYFLYLSMIRKGLTLIHIYDGTVKKVKQVFSFYSVKLDSFPRKVIPTYSLMCDTSFMLQYIEMTLPKSKVP